MKGRYRWRGIKPHPARFPHGLPEFFIKFLTDPGDLVVDPFAGSNITGEVAERLQRRWVAFEIIEEYLEASKFRFPGFCKQGSFFDVQMETVEAEPAVEDGGDIAASQLAFLESSAEYQGGDKEGE